MAKVNDEMAAFWQKENGKRNKVRRKDCDWFSNDESVSGALWVNNWLQRRESSSEDELDDETLANIVREAEMAPDVSEWKENEKKSHWSISGTNRREENNQSSRIFSRKEEGNIRKNV